MQKHSPNANISHAIASFALMLAGSITIGLSTEAYRGEPAAPVGVLAGGGLIAAGVGLDRRHRLTGDDYFEGLRQIAASGQDALNLLWSENKSSLRQIIPIQCLPEQYRSLVSIQADRLLGENWVREFVRRSKIVCGITRSGKTVYLLHEVACFFQDHADGHLTIIDLDYGSPDEDGNRNFWYDLPKERFIRDTFESAIETIEAEYNELQRRIAENKKSTKATHRWQRRKLLIDELPAIVAEANLLDEGLPPAKRLLPKLKVWISQLLSRGLKQQIEVTFGTQSLAVTKTGLDLAMQDQCNFLILGGSAIDIDTVARLPAVKDAAALIEDVKRIRKLPGCQYAAIAKIGHEEPCIKVVPHLDVTAVELALPLEPKDAIDIWWEATYTPDIAAWLDDLAARYHSGEIKSPLKAEICPRFKVETRLTDPKYSKVKLAWENAQLKAKGEV